MARRDQLKAQTATEGEQSAQDQALQTPPETGDVSTPAQDSSQQEILPAQPADATPPPNIILSKQADPVTEGALGFKGIVLPDAETQRRGWYEPKARYILQMYGGTYKVPVEKGG
jgi:hypothetical protein